MYFLLHLGGVGRPKADDRINKNHKTKDHSTSVLDFSDHNSWELHSHYTVLPISGTFTLSLMQPFLFYNWPIFSCVKKYFNWRNLSVKFQRSCSSVWIFFGHILTDFRSYWFGQKTSLIISSSTINVTEIGSNSTLGSYYWNRTSSVPKSVPRGWIG